MTDYIKREDAMDGMHNVDDAKHIRALPPADVAPVRHGRWVEYGENKDGTHNMRCSKCVAWLKSKGHANSFYTKHKYRYCPNCGAKMDLED